MHTYRLVIHNHSLEFILDLEFIVHWSVKEKRSVCLFLSKSKTLSLSMSQQNILMTTLQIWQILDNEVCFKTIDLTTSSHLVDMMNAVHLLWRIDDWAECVQWSESDHCVAYRSQPSSLGHERVSDGRQLKFSPRFQSILTAAFASYLM